ncbi:MAG: flavocytochrome C [Betaproteobacteria bacterium]|nr:MAG: flavocytochrome C [Betaproteobacteria bacterium]
MNRRRFLAAGATALAACATSVGKARPRVVVVGAGFGGATLAKYIALWDRGIDVTLVERGERFISCPISNLVLGGTRTMQDITQNYDGLRKYGVQLAKAEALAIDSAKRTISLSGGSTLPYDRLVLSPGVDFLFDEVQGYDAAGSRILHAWKAGAQTVELRRRLEAMPEGGVYLLSVPLAPYRCPPGPYERACQVAHYFKRAKPRAKVLVLDANADVTSKGPLFKRAWEELYKGMIEYHPNAKVVAVDPAAMSVRTDFDTVKGDVLNVVPPQRAADIAAKTGLITHNNRWCDVDWRTLESKAQPGIHLLGDATLSASGMPKSGHMANQHAKVCAAALIELLNGRAPNATPVMNITCYSFVSDKEVIHVASVHQYEPVQNALLPVKGAGGVSAARSELEGQYAWSWAQNIWADMLA